VRRFSRERAAHATGPQQVCEAIAFRDDNVHHAGGHKRETGRAGVNVNAVHKQCRAEHVGRTVHGNGLAVLLSNAAKAERIIAKAGRRQTRQHG
jgi:hypothetical protein